MRAVIGIDAAWTASQPSGVALYVERGGAWRCEAVAPSYADFAALGEGRRIDWGRARVRGGAPDPGQVLGAARALAPQARLVAVALDLPLAHGPITGRREADQAVSRAYGSRGCGTHSPSPTRPGPISTVIRDGFEAAGLRLATAAPRPDGPALLEVYPHTALLSLLRADRRVAYKVSRSGAYWPGAAAGVRRERLRERWRAILAALGERLEIALELPAAFPTFSAMKRYEDALDAVVCAWVAIEFVDGNTAPLGDADAAIWTPRPVSA